MGMVYVGTGTVWENLTHAIPPYGTLLPSQGEVVVAGSHCGSDRDSVLPCLAVSGSNETVQSLIELEVELQIGNGCDREFSNKCLNIAKQTDFTCCEFNSIKQQS